MWFKVFEIFCEIAFIVIAAITKDPLWAIAAGAFAIATAV